MSTKDNIIYYTILGICIIGICGFLDCLISFELRSRIKENTHKNTKAHQPNINIDKKNHQDTVMYIDLNERHLKVVVLNYK